LSSDPYSAQIRALFADLSHAGDLDNAICSEIDDQGVHIRLAATCRGGCLQALRFRAWGCPHVLAACEAVCREYEGRPASDLEEFRATRIMEILSIPLEKTGRILVIEDTVRSLGRSMCDGSVPPVS